MANRVIPFSTKVHGVLDYAIGILLISMPRLVDLPHDVPAARYVFIVLGGIHILYSLFTKYELGLIRVIPMSAHKILDYITAAMLMVAPWALGIADEITLPYVLLAIPQLLIPSLSRHRMPKHKVALEPEPVKTDAGSIS
jgi:hypothetical protein